MKKFMTNQPYYMDESMFMNQIYHMDENEFQKK